MAQELLNNNLDRKLAAIMAEVDFIEKDTTHERQGWTYASEFIIKKTLREAFVKHGVLFNLAVDTAEIQGPMVIVKGQIHLTDVDSGFKYKIPVIGAGHSRDEKGVYAAITGAIKYGLTSNFLIPTGDDAEKDEPKLITKEQIAQIEALIKESGKEAKTIYDWIEEKYGSPLNELTTEGATQLVVAMKKKVAESLK